VDTRGRSASHAPGAAAPAAAVALACALACCVACGAAGQSAAPSGTPAPVSTSLPANPNLSQCGKDTREITDAAGTVTAIHGTPHRVVTVEYSFTDDVSLLGVSPVGLGDDDDPSTVIPQIRARIGPYTSIGVRSSPNLAVIAGLKPDLIVADVLGNKAILGQLRAIAPTLALRSEHASYPDNIDAAVTIGAAMDRCAKMSAVLAAHDALLARLKAQVPATDHRSFAIVLSSSKTVTVFNSEQYNSQVLELLGLRAVATDTTLFPPGDAQGVTLETLAALDPQILFYANVLEAPTGLLDTYRSSPVFKATAAARTNQIFRVAQNSWSLTRGITGSEVIAAEAVHDLYGK
jgi:ferric citrate transport system substrate-binding protein